MLRCRLLRLRLTSNSSGLRSVAFALIPQSEVSRGYLARPVTIATAEKSKTARSRILTTAGQFAELPRPLMLGNSKCYPKGLLLSTPLCDLLVLIIALNITGR
jgi:hypothetical protein